MIRFYLLLFLFLVSLLSFLRAPQYHLWLLAIGVTEFPLVFFGITMLVTVNGFWSPRMQLTGTILGIITMLIFLSPVVRAYGVAKNMKSEMGRTFGSPFMDRKPLSFLRLFKSAKNAPCKTLTYVSYQDISLKLDYFPTRSSGKSPCVIVVHGGSWAGGDSKQLPELNTYLAEKGYNVAALNYRLAPKYQTPAPVEDIKNAMIYLKAHARDLNIDTSKFVLLGRSAGAQIALLAAYTLHEPDLKGVIDFYGPADMVWGYSIPSNPLIMDSRKVMDDYIGGPYSKVPQKYVVCSPLEFVDKNSVPTLMIHGTNDVLVSPEHSRRLNEKLEKKGVKHYWLKLPWATHGFDFNLNGPGGQLSTFAVESFLHTVTK